MGDVAPCPEVSTEVKRDMNKLPQEFKEKKKQTRLEGLETWNKKSQDQLTELMLMKKMTRTSIS